MSLQILNILMLENIDKLDVNDFHPKSSTLTAEIYIDGNQDWQDLKDAGNCTGYGNSTHPYIIRDWDIDGQGELFACIMIRNSDVYFQIENCTLYNASYGIYLYNVSNIQLNNITSYSHISGIRASIISNITLNNITSFSNEYDGITLNRVDNLQLNNSHLFDNERIGIRSDYCNNSNISDCIINNNGNSGISLEGNHNNKLYNNSIIDCKWGIRLSQSNNCELKGNKMIRCGLQIIGVTLNIDPLYIYVDPLCFDHKIHADNTVNGKCLYYYKNELTLNSNNLSNAGQVILYNCSYAVIEDLNLSYTSIGLQLISSHFNTIYNITANNNSNCGIYIVEGSNNDILNNIMNDNSDFGISLESSNYNTIFNNEIIGNHKGIAIENNWLQSCDHNKIEHNVIENNGYSGITLYRCSNNIITLNEINNNLNGISMDKCYDSFISFNNIDNNIENGILFKGSENNEIYRNIISNNDIGIYLYYSKANELNRNSFFGNKVNIYIIGDNGNGPSFIDFFSLLTVIGIFLGLTGSLAAVSIYKIHKRKNDFLKETEHIQKEKQFKSKNHAMSSKEILNIKTNKELLLQIFDPEMNQKTNKISEGVYLSSFSEEFLEKVDKLGLSSIEKKEFLEEMFSFTPTERNDIVNDILSKLSKKSYRN